MRRDYLPDAVLNLFGELAMKRTVQIHRRQRRGSIVVLSAFLMIVMVAFLAFTIDLGYLVNTNTELQRTADSAAIAAAWSLIDEASLTGDTSATTAISNARSNAVSYCAMNSVCGDAPTVDPNSSNHVDGDVVIGYLPAGDYNAVMTFPSSDRYNAVQVLVRRTESQNGLVPHFFARVLGHDGIEASANATAAIGHEIGGFRIPEDGSNLGMLPFSLDEDTWNDMLAGGGDDNWSWNDVTETISSGSDSIREVNLFPQGTGSPGNRGTVDIGGNSNSTADIARQILDGVTPEDLDYHGGTLELDEFGELFLNGDTGISAGVKDELVAIIGEPKVIPIFREVNGPGDNAQYKIVKFVGVRILEVNLTGAATTKRVIIQPANITAKGTISSNSAGTSDFVYSVPVLVR